jgi:hypothetical protein
VPGSASSDARSHLTHGGARARTATIRGCRTSSCGHLLATIDASLVGVPGPRNWRHHLGFPTVGSARGDASDRAALFGGPPDGRALPQRTPCSAPVCLRDWAGRRPGGPVAGRGRGTSMPDLAWQPPLWRAVGARVWGADAGADPRHDATVARLTRRSRDSFEQVPARVSLFGHTRLARQRGGVAAGPRAIQREVHLWLPHPSAPALWGRLAATGARGSDRRDARTIRSVMAVEHPLLVSLGRDLRELQRQLRVAGRRCSR